MDPYCTLEGWDKLLSQHNQQAGGKVEAAMDAVPWPAGLWLGFYNANAAGHVGSRPSTTQRLTSALTKPF
jgi:hypothetical protein